MQQWVTINKKADFKGIGSRFGIDQVTARVIRNRDIIEEADIDLFLNGDLGSLHDPHQMKDADRLVDILEEKIAQKKAIRVIGDYDIDGVMATYILKSALARCGADVSIQIPDRIRDGYGLNRHLIELAHEDEVDTILTCDNGIAALDEIALAKELGMTVLVTDHHELPFQEEDGQKILLKSNADAIVNPHQKECRYPCKHLCGAAVAWKVVCLLYEKMGIAVQEAETFLENVAFATVGDIMELSDENRILVKEGLKRIHLTQNIGMKALIAQCGLQPEQVEAYHFGYVLGPCINATGRLDTAQRALELLSATDAVEAQRIANELVVLNSERKTLTEQGVEEAVKIYEQEGYEKDPVIVIYMPQVHESIAGIIAGRIRERYYKPTFILTRGEDGVKGSGRSVEEYSMHEQMGRCQELFTRYGGHPMAAGLSLEEKNVDIFRRKINELCPEECRNLMEKVKIDVPMPVDYVTMDLVRELHVLEPFGKGNPRPVFADRNLSIQRMWIVGKNKNVLRLTLISSYGNTIAAIYFGNIVQFQNYLAEKFGSAEVEAAFHGKGNLIRISVIYNPKINSYRNTESLQFEIISYK